MDPLIKSQLLYQLSYAPAGPGAKAGSRDALISHLSAFVQPLWAHAGGTGARLVPSARSGAAGSPAKAWEPGGFRLAPEVM